MLRLILRMNRALSRVGPPFRRTGRFLRMGMMELGEGGEGGRDLVKEGRGEASKLHNGTVFGCWIKTLLCKTRFSYKHRHNFHHVQVRS